MRRFMFTLVVSALYGSAATAQTCLRPAEQQAFNVVALKSALMVSALSCDQSKPYDAFMAAFQPHILAEQHVMDGYFRRAGGLAGQSQEDDYVTLLANTQSADSIAEGAHFCAASAALFTQVAGLNADAQLDTLAAAKPSVEPADAVSCAIPAHGVSNHATHALPPAYGLITAHAEHIRQPGETLTVADNQ